MSDNKYISIDIDGKKRLKDLSDIDISVFNNDAGYSDKVGDMSKAVYDTSNDGKCDISNFSDSCNWYGIIGKPNSTTANIDESVSMRHTHANKTIIDKFTEVGNTPYYNGNELALSSENVTKTSQITNDSGFVTNVDLDKKSDRLTTFIEDNIMTISSNGGLRDSGRKLTDFATSEQGTKADNALPTSSYTASDVLNKIKTVDGASSGLDADKLDGQEGSYYAPIDSPVFTGTPKSVTPITSDNSTNIATTSYVKAQGYITSVTDSTTTQKINVKKSDTLIGNRSNINLIEGSGVTLTMADNTTTRAVDITISSTNGGGTVKSVNTVTPNVSTGDVTLTKSDLSLGNVDNVQQLPMSYLDTAITLGTSNIKVSSQNAVKTYVDNGLTNKVNKTITVNGHALSSNVTVSASDITTGTLPSAQLPFPTATTIGGVYAGDNITIAPDGKISSVVGSGDMLKSIYDSNSDGIVNDSDKLGGQLPSYYAKESDLDLKTSINDSNTTSLTETYSINKILSLISSKQNKIYIQNIQPTSPSIDDVWINNTSTPYIMNVYNGTIFVQVGGESNGKTITSWTSGNAYSVDDLAIYNENIYKCTIGNSDTSWIIGNWSLISSGETQIQSNWTEIDTSSLAYIKNKPTLPIGTIVGTTDVQTLTNKDITSNTNKFGIISPKTDSVSSIKITKSDGTTAITTVDSTNNIFKINNCLGFPVLTTTQRNALIGLSGGETVFDSTLNITMCYDGSFWFQV